jgi:hypothetical protein
VSGNTLRSIVVSLAIRQISTCPSGRVWDVQETGPIVQSVTGEWGGRGKGWDDFRHERIQRKVKVCEGVQPEGTGDVRAYRERRNLRLLARRHPPIEGAQLAFDTAEATQDLLDLPVQIFMLDARDVD